MRAGFVVTATDYYADALRFARANAWRNDRRELRTMLVDWRAMPEEIGRYDVVVAADVLYEMRYAELIAGAIFASLEDDGTAIIADPGRIAVSQFLEACADARLSCTERVVRPFVEGTIRQTITMYIIRHAAS
jgi:2-polyprenyl-3-methyl-5-hydroxy-6-metoxy-1,4-benzoquinol methylase